jgi:murein DD-endopeptidase MepM/ murein hydrolase activator NlpD
MPDYSKQQVLDIVETAAKNNNVPRDDFLRFTAIETGFSYDENAHNRSSDAKGLFQFLPDTARQYGIAGREFDPVANADAGARLYNDNKQDIIASHGRSGRPYLSGEAEPNGLDLYMAHQQGAYGYRSIQAALDRGTFFDDTPTRRNLLANVGNDVESLTGVKKSDLNGLSDRDLAKTFMQYWDTKYDRIAIPEKGIEPLDKSQPNRTSPSPSSPADPMADGVLKHGENGTAVKNLQEALNKAGIRDAEGQPLPTTGYYGDKTEAAVRAYQTQKGLEVDGKAGNDTLTSLGLKQGQQPTTQQPTPQQPTPEQPTPTRPAADQSWPAPGNLTVNRADKPGEGEGEFGTSRGGGARTHKGIDIVGKVGDPIEPMRAGKVTFAGDGGPGAGNMIIVDHGGGLETRYLHLNSINVKEGQQVTENTRIGTMGRTGNTPTEGDTHLHFETRENGVAVDPRKYLEFPPRTLLQHNDQGPDVKHLQEALNKAGVRDAQGQPLPTTGFYGDKTEAAVRSYQQQHGLEVDGKAGKDTLTALGVYPGQQQTTQADKPQTPATPVPATQTDKPQDPANAQPQHPASDKPNTPANTNTVPATQTDKPQDPANTQPQHPTQTDKPLISNPNHPDNKLYQQAVSNLEQLGPSGGFKSREELEKAAAAVAVDAKATGLQNIDHISKTNAPNGQAYLVAVQGDPTSPAAKNSYIDYGQAVNQTVAQSTSMAEAQKPAVQMAQQTEQPQQEQNKVANIR